MRYLTKHVSLQAVGRWGRENDKVANIPENY